MINGEKAAQVAEYTEKEKKRVFKKFANLEKERQDYQTLWQNVSHYTYPVSTVSTNFTPDTSKVGTSNVLPYIDEPIGYNSVIQAGDYLQGVLWGEGEKVFNLVPSKWVKSKIEDPTVLEDFYKKQTERVLEELNNSSTNLGQYIRAHCYEQNSFGTSGIGIFINNDYNEGKSAYPLVCKGYSVDNSVFQEGKDGTIDSIYTVYDYTAYEIVEEFAVLNDELVDELYNRLPNRVKTAYKEEQLDIFQIVHGIIPNQQYRLGNKGKSEHKYKGYFFVKDSNNILFTEFYKEFPVPSARYIRIRNKTYGWSPAIMALPSIKLLNFVTGQTSLAIEQLVVPPKGILGGSLMPGTEIDLTSGNVLPFNPEFLTGKAAPLFNLNEVGDITGNVSYLAPKLEEQITQMFKIDRFIDINNKTEMTATEFLGRENITSMSMSGVLSQQKDFIEKLIIRSVSLLGGLGLLWATGEEEAKAVMLNKSEEILPDEVKEVMDAGLDWFKIRFNNDLFKLNKTAGYNNLINFLQVVSAIIQVKPESLAALNEYEILEYSRDVLNLNIDRFIKSKINYERILEQQAQQQQSAMQLQALNMSADTAAKAAMADKTVYETKEQ